MLERRRRGSAEDTGARTRRTDREDAPRGIHEWVTTFSLRWAEHRKRKAGGRKPRPA